MIAHLRKITTGKFFDIMLDMKEMLKKVPEISIYFWILKLCSTAMGEATSDALVHEFKPEVVVVIAALVLAIVLVIQLHVSKYMVWVYWTTVVMVAVCGTMVADVIHIQFGVPYIVSSISFLVILIGIFISWYLSEKTLSIHSIYTRKREIFYWLTVMATFALGTAVGDLFATTLHLGYFVSGIVFAVMIAIIASSYFLFKLHEVAAFWISYILTRPVGASFADWIGKSHAVGGLNFGDGNVSLVLTLAIICIMIYLTALDKQKKLDQQI